MVGLNRATIIGNLGADPEVRFTNGGKQVASLRVATNERWRDKATGEMKEATEWHAVVIWNPNLIKVAEQYLTKGAQVFIEGKMRTRKWTNQSGAQQSTTEIVLENFDGKIIMLGGGSGTALSPAAPNSNPAQKVSLAEELDDEIPF